MNTKRQRGSALIEFAGSLVLLSAMFVGIFQTGYTFFTYGTLVSAVRAGARYASLRSPHVIAADPEFAKTVANMVVYGEPRPAAGKLPVVKGLGPENVEVMLGTSSATVSVRDFVVDAIFMKLKLSGRPTVTFPFTSGGAQ